MSRGHVIAVINSSMSCYLIVRGKDWRSESYNAVEVHGVLCRASSA
jgi:hypothetical protein